MAGSRRAVAGGVGQVPESVMKGGVVITATRPPAIAATGLRKLFGNQMVLDGIDLQIAAGTIFALLGPNGAGKYCTAIRTVAFDRARMDKLTYAGLKGLGADLSNVTVQ
jgi:ABC-type dipeptide/oligopeptide/nickel transport system ATPase subunit